MTERHRLEFSPQARRVAIGALESLSEQRFLLAYEKSRGEDSRKKDRVEAVAPLIRLERKKGDRTIRITPNPVLVDHIDSYFILTPVNIFDLADGRRITQLRFLEFLLYQAEMKRRQQVRDEKESEYEIRLQSEKIAHRVRMDGLLASRRRTLLRTAINDLYSFGVKVGFLESFQVDQKGTKGRIIDVLKLNKAKFEEFKSPQSLVLPGAKSTSSTSKV